MDQWLAAFAFAVHGKARHRNRDARSEQLFYASFDGPPSIVGRLMARIRGAAQPLAVDDCHNCMACLDHSNKQAMG